LKINLKNLINPRTVIEIQINARTVTGNHKNVRTVLEIQINPRRVTEIHQNHENVRAVDGNKSSKHLLACNSLTDYKPG
jgi:hypothetical protein